ncbi:MULTISPECIES: DEAD/DEAH box helicase [Pseudomonas syringae group]|uniref:DEAD-box ATP-dependent RNA helicase RhpA n=2 Tax=Pseudomonas viridiflava TaxID=33069 RepID=A0AA46W323_PSEVI|nr:DEAD/DEAH box helicase [Pseudomonas viridiflava]KTC13380.1 DEAD/DEAH box helicase [Pseudomonas marginalis ICMP 11289]MCF8978026.1 DEAD/DEAH box helicase [Pseudomonas syringae]MCQ9391462.1 DEAD/DEAH box helicase [Pseudomonas viridiflava]MEE4075848.1 DEAD/DEAH box helicase [Pseudomonas viridiflava]MEE4095665.1 DEAD/DEAH box helicase [Pseudomonas viridiflava]
MTFASLGLIEPLLRALDALGYQTPTPVQAQAIPPVLAGRDLMAAAQTGTGKTAGFALPLLQRLTMEGPKVAPNTIRALVLAPTRELAEQVHESIRQYAEHLPLSTYAVYGGVSINPQMMKLRKGVDVLVATPGRLLDLHRQNAVKFSQLQTLILDEADRMLDLGFAEELRGIYAALPKRRQTLLFSATFSDPIRLLASQMLDDPLTIEVSPRNVAAASVKQWVVTVDKKRKADLFIHLMKKHRWGQVLVFAKTRVGVDQLVDRLQALGLNADGIHGDKPQATRQRALDRFKSNEVKILVATDVAARGLDIDDLPTVVNLDLPIVAEDYIHRIGRTGRAGLTGEAISLVCADEVELLSAIEVLTRQTLERREEQDFEPEHRVPSTDASGQILKKPKKPKKPKVSGSKRNLGKWVDSGDSEPAPAAKPVRKVPVFNTGPRKKKP